MLQNHFTHYPKQGSMLIRDSVNSRGLQVWLQTLTEHRKNRELESTASGAGYCCPSLSCPLRCSALLWKPSQSTHFNRLCFSTRAVESFPMEPQGYVKPDLGIMLKTDLFHLYISLDM